MKQTRLPKIKGNENSVVQGIRLHADEWVALQELAGLQGWKRNQLIRQILVSAIEQAKSQNTKPIFFDPTSTSPKTLNRQDTPNSASAVELEIFDKESSLAH